MDHDHQMSGNSGMSTTKRYTHMTFFWGKNSEILFTQWPGTRTGIVAAGLLRTVLHTLHVGLAYLVMLALMSFNVGVLIVAIAGHAAGFFVFGSRIFKRGEKSGEESDLGPPLKC
uniref:Copper transport protein n=1 Tax=Nelumbo nucifera TaxID=4432 RepID=A0A822Y361_NELNU|nr:TPA_asm: hypothetical protein HUJ06_029822 [Nelumbo nucifera]